MAALLLIALFCYLVGGLPTAYLLMKYMTGKDIRTVGSGNSGATNAGRFLGLPGFATVLLLDALKAYMALTLVQVAASGDALAMLVATVFVYIGNAYSPFIHFSGGKGVATTVGIMLYIFPLWLFCMCLAVFAWLAHTVQRVDVASLGAVASAPVLLLVTGYSAYVVLSALAIAIWVWMRHARNIAQLIALYWGKV